MKIFKGFRTEDAVRAERFTIMQTNNRYIAIGLMLFALFFGAGNLIFPAAMGQSAGTDVWWAVAGFCVTGVGLPLLGIAAMGYSGCRDLQEAAGRVHPWYGLFYCVVSYMAIGPCFALPRTGTVSYEIAVHPFFQNLDSAVAQPIFLACFFGLSYWLAASPNKLIDRIGKVLTPALLIVILILIVKSFITPLGVPQAPSAIYADAGKSLIQGILDGYNTLDAIASVIFATLVINFIKDSGVTEKAEITRQVIKSGIVAAIPLAFIYVFIAKIGADSVAALGHLDTGAPVLAGAAQILFGQFGAILLALIVLLACLTTAIGLITCCAAYFMSLCGRFSYKTYAAIFSVVSFLIGLFGLKTIITSTIPVLMFIYPLVMALIALLFLDKVFGGRQCVYAWTMGCTLIMATVTLFETAGVSLGTLSPWMQQNLPLHNVGISWILFAVVGFVIGLIWKAVFPCKKAAAC